MQTREGSHWCHLGCRAFFVVELCVCVVDSVNHPVYLMWTYFDMNLCLCAIVLEWACKYTQTCPIPGKIFDLTSPKAVSIAWHAKSWLLESVHHVVYSPGAGFSVGLPSILVFQASGVLVVVEGWHMNSHPAALFWVLWLKSFVLTPSCW